MNSRDQPSNETTSNGGPHAFLLRLEMSLQTDPEECIRELDGAVIPEELHVRALWLRARALQAMRRPAETLPLLEEALSLARLRCDARMMAELEYLYSGVCFHLHSFDEALCHARLALEACSEDRDDRPLHGKIVMGLGHIHFIRGNFDEALGYYRRALTIFSSLRDLCSLGSLYSGMAGIYDAKGDHRKALQYAKRRVAAHEAIGDAWAAVEGQAVLATAYRGMNDLDRAEDVAKRALSRAQELVQLGIDSSGV